MAYDLSPEGDAAALKARRGDLRAFCEGLADLLVDMPMPESFVEAERGARAVYVADRALVRVREETLGGADEECPTTTPSARSPSPTSGEEQEEPLPDGEELSLPYLMTRVRLRLRDYADRLMEATAALDKPTCYLEAERAARYALAADRMLGQLYAPPKPAKSRFGEDEDLEPEGERPPYDDLEAWQNLFLNKLLRIRQGHASAAGFWPNGAPYIDGEPEPEVGSPFPISAAFETGRCDSAKESEMLVKSRAWHAQTHQRDSELSEAEKAELIARIEAGWNSGQLQQDYPPRFPSPPHSMGSGAARAVAEGPEGSLAERSDPSVIFGQEASMPPPHTWGGEDEGPSIRVIESVFAPNRFGRRPCGCSLSAPKCVGPCPIPP